MANSPEPTKGSSSKQNPASTAPPPRKPQVLDARALRDLNQQRRAAPPRPPTSPEDIRKTPQYKAAARRWTSTIVALPILIYSSYILYERSTGKQQQKHLSRENASSSATPESS